MADNVSITAGSGTVISTEEVTTLNGGAVSAQQVQRVAAAIRTADSTAVDLPGDATNGLDVDVTRLPALVAGTAYIGKVRLTDGTNDLAIDTAHSDGEVNAENHLDTAARGYVYNGTTWDRRRGDATTGAFVGGAVAHDSPDSGNPVKIGMRAVNHGTSPTSVTAADRTDWLANRAGIPFVIGGHPNVLTLKHTDITTAVTNASIIAGAANTRIVVTRLTVTLDSASTVFPLCRIGFAASTTPTTTGVLFSHGGVPAGGGATIGDGSGIIGVSAAGDALLVTTTGNATGAGLHITVSYYTISEA